MDSSGYGFRASNWAARQPQYDITLPSVLYAERIPSELPHVSLHICLHINRHLRSAGKSPP